MQVTLPSAIPYVTLGHMKITGGVRIRSNAKKLVVRSSVKGGRIATNHNAKKLVVRSHVRGGRIATNHNASVAR